MICSILTVVVLLLTASILLNMASSMGRFGENKAKSNIGYYVGGDKKYSVGQFKDPSELS